MTNKSILVIDDEASIRELLQVCLSDLAGWSVATAASTQEGLRKLAQTPHDAIILEAILPGMDVIMFLQKLRENALLKSIPVVFLTVKANWFTPQQLQDIGVVAAIAKPFNPLTLPTAIAQALHWDLQP